MAVRRRLFLALVLLAAAALVPPLPAPAQKRPRVLALLSSERPSYREHLKRFQERLPADLEVIVLPETPAQAPPLEARNPDLILALGGAAAERAARLPAKPPLVFAMVYDPKALGLPNGPNQCGTALKLAPEETLKALAALRPKTSLTIGALHDPAAGPRELDELAAALKTAGHLLTVAEVAGPGRFEPALKSLLPKIDALWVLNEPSLIGDTDLLVEKVLRPAADAKVAAIGLSDFQARKGALLAASVDYVLEGYHSARLAGRVLSGEAPAKIGVEAPESVVWSINLKVAAELGWEVPPLVRKRFERVYQ